MLTMKYKWTITDEKGVPITPIYKAGTPAEHFAACVTIYLDLLNGGVIRQLISSKHKETASTTRSLIAALMPGGQINESLMKLFRQTTQPLPFAIGTPLLFIGDLHKHSALTPEDFLTTWGNIGITELRQLMNCTVTDTSKSLPLFIAFLNKIKMPGLGKCIVEPINPAPANTTATTDAKANSPAYAQAKAQVTDEKNKDHLEKCKSNLINYQKTQTLKDPQIYLRLLTQLYEAYERNSDLASRQARFPLIMTLNNMGVEFAKVGRLDEANQYLSKASFLALSHPLFEEEISRGQNLQLVNHNYARLLNGNEVVKIQDNEYLDSNNAYYLSLEKFTEVTMMVRFKL